MDYFEDETQTKIKPHKINVDLLYICPYCVSYQWIDYLQIKKTSKFICDNCYTIVNVDQISNVSLSFSSSSNNKNNSNTTKNNIDNTKPPSSPSNNKNKPKINTHSKDYHNTNDYTTLVSTFVSLGWSKKQAKNIIDSGIERGYNIKDHEDFVTNVLVNINK